MKLQKVIVTEPQVILATLDWLLERGVLPYRFSISGGTREEREVMKADIHNWYAGTSKTLEKSLVPDFSRGGPDIEAISSSEWWRIECKGAGKGVRRTQRNNFDRALASVVSYYTDQTEEIGADLKNRALFLGLALPDTDTYINELKRRVGKPLRRRLELWILLFETSTGQIRPISPVEEVQ